MVFLDPVQFSAGIRQRAQVTNVRLGILLWGCEYLKVYFYSSARF